MEKIKSIENFRSKEILLNHQVLGGVGETGAGSMSSAICSSGVCWTSDCVDENGTTEYYGIYDCDMPPGSGDDGGYSGDNGGLTP